MARLTNDKAAIRQLFTGVVHPREALLRFGDTRVVMAENPATTLEQVFARLVERDFADKEYHDKLVDRGVRELLRKANLRDQFSDATIGNEDLHLAVPFAHFRDGRVQVAIKPLDLDKDEANKVFDVGGRLVDRVRRLAKRNLLPQEMLVAVREPPNLERNIQAAVVEIETDLRNAGILVERADNETAITRFARAALN